MEKVKNIMKMENYYLKVNISMTKNGEVKGKNIIKMVIYILKVNI